jgi:hypothetical protein
MTRVLARASAGFVLTTILLGQQEEGAEVQRRLAAHAELFTFYNLPIEPLFRRTPDKNAVVSVAADLTVYGASAPMLPWADGYLEDPADQELGGLIVSSPTIVLAVAAGHRSAFTPGATFIYSDWDFVVQRVFKDRGPESVKLHSTITVTRPGGSLVQNGITYVAEDQTFPEFQKGSSYILFLQPLPESHSFQVSEGNCFLLAGSAISALDTHRWPSALSERVKSMTADEFSRTLKARLGSAAAK